MYCKHCGQTIDNDSNFCSHCGGKVQPLNQVNKNSASENVAPKIPEFIHFKKFSLPISPTPLGRIEKWLTKKVKSDDVATIQQLEKEKWERYDPKEKKYECQDCGQVVEFDFVAWLQNKWWERDYKEGYSAEPYYYCCHQCMVSIRMTQDPD